MARSRNGNIPVALDFLEGPDCCRTIEITDQEKLMYKTTPQRHIRQNHLGISWNYSSYDNRKIYEVIAIFEELFKSISCRRDLVGICQEAVCYFASKWLLRQDSTIATISEDLRSRCNCRSWDCQQKKRPGVNEKGKLSTSSSFSIWTSFFRNLL